MAISHKGAVDSGGIGRPMTLCVTRPPASKPSKNNQRQLRSGPEKEPQAMPLMPAIRPSESSNHIAERPNSTPPVSGIRYVFITVTLLITNGLRPVTDRGREGV